MSKRATGNWQLATSQNFVASRVTRHASRTHALLIALVFGFATAFVNAAELFDPMRPPSARSSATRVAQPVSRVTAIFSAGDRRVAIFDGRVVRVGDRVGDVTIQAILSDGVRFAQAGRVEFARLPKQAVAVRRGASGVEEDQ